jgi:twitching motility protein PilT
MIDVMETLRSAVECEASDVFFVAGAPYAFRVSGSIVTKGETRLMPDDLHGIVEKFYELQAQSALEALSFEGLRDADFSFSVSRLGRFRANIYKQRGSHAAVLRVVRFELPDPKALNISDVVMNLAERNRGMILITGAAGSGKSTTLACMVDRINRSRPGHIITIEDPIEYVHSHKTCLVSQREVQQDTDTYLTALRAALRQSPNVVLLGEMRDFETISVALTAAETGQLVLSTLHTIGAAHTIDRIIDVFPAGQQSQIRTQLSMCLEAVVSQQLLPTKDGKLMPVFEIMIMNNAVRNLIRENKLHQINNIIFSSSGEGMVTMDTSILALYDKGLITPETARRFAANYETVVKHVGAG